jgi:hypothetical protein
MAIAARQQQAQQQQAAAAAAQAYNQAISQTANRGTLTPGQTITLNECTVTVERYLSQGEAIILIS